MGKRPQFDPDVVGERAAEDNAQDAFEREQMDRDEDMANWADDYDRAWSKR